MREVWTDGTSEAFRLLTAELDAYMREINGERQAAFTPYNGLAELHDVLLLCEGDTPVACGAFKRHPSGDAELKRIFVRPAYRRHGYARALLTALEIRAAAQGCRRLILETNRAFTGAVKLYESFGFHPIPAFPPYDRTPGDSICMAKEEKQ
ncbi:MAG: GNAT family N-acetyltransferase [Eubacteriales bacterium]|nr:GNAT family N-acetyltransferase [Eubacteriales bacterium]